MAWSVGGEAGTGLQVILTLKLLPRPFSVDRDSRENASQKGGERRMIWGEIRALSHTLGITRLDSQCGGCQAEQTWVLCIRRVPSRAQEAEG